MAALTERIEIRISKQLRKRIQAAADKDRRRLSEWLRLAVEDAADKAEKTPRTK